MVMGILDKMVAEAPAKRQSTVVNTKLGVKAHAAIRDTAIRSGLTMSEIVRNIVHGTLEADGVDINDDVESDAEESKPAGKAARR